MDIGRSGTRRDELLHDENTLQKVWLLRRMATLISANSQNPTEATERVIERLAKTASNAEFLATLTKDV
jgi:transcription termination factor Rho